jgi:hypothetical protein
LPAGEEPELETSHVIFREGQMWTKESPKGGFTLLVLKTEGSLHGSTEGWVMWDHESIVTRAWGEVRIVCVGESVEVPFENDKRMRRIV